MIAPQRIITTASSAILLWALLATTGSAATCSAVACKQFAWRDNQRGRMVTATLCYPTCRADGQPIGTVPLAIYSHGLGSSPGDFNYLAQAWAGQGIATLLVRHQGNDDAAWKGHLFPLQRMKSIYRQNHDAEDHVGDLRLAIAMLDQANTAGSLPIALDMNRIGIAGNDLGALATMILAGREIPGTANGTGYTMPCVYGETEVTENGGLHTIDDRIRAIIVLSPPVPETMADHSRIYSEITVPSLFVTGTCDDGVVGPTRAGDRRIPFDHVGGDSWLITFSGTDHMIYSGHILPGHEANDRFYQSLIAQATTAFWISCLKESPQPTDCPLGTQLSTVIAGRGCVEEKSAEQGEAAESETKEPTLAAPLAPTPVDLVNPAPVL